MSAISATISPLDLRSPDIHETFSTRRKPCCTRVLYAVASAPLSVAQGAYTLTRKLVQKAIRKYVYYASSDAFKAKMDAARIDLSRQAMREFGGKTVAIQTKDGDWIEGMFFDAEDFKRAIVQAGGRFIVTASGEQLIRSYDDRLTKALKAGLKLDGTYVDDPHVDDDLVFQVKLPPATLVEPSISRKQVMILTQGNGGIFEMDRAHIGETLLTGQSCMVFNLRGTGRSHGAPNENRTYEDIDAVYQFLRSKGFAPSQIGVKGYCLGAGLAVELATRHPVHLILDRPFSRIGDIVGDIAADLATEYMKTDPKTLKGRILRGLVTRLVATGTDTFAISYNNASKIHRVQGSILFIHSDVDEVIPERSREIIQAAVRKHPRATIHTSDKFGHNHFWDEATDRFHLQHLKRGGLFRRYPNTAVPLHVSLARLEKAEREKRQQALRASVVAGGLVAVGPAGASAGAVGTEMASVAYKHRRSTENG